MTAEEFRKIAKQSESDLQTQCVAWFRIAHPAMFRLLFSIPNGAKLYGDKVQRAKQWRRLEREGAMKGAADLFLSIPSGLLAGLYIEMKTPRGRQSEDQKLFESAVIEQGYGYAMPHSFEEFQGVIRRYLEIGEY